MPSLGDSVSGWAETTDWSLGRIDIAALANGIFEYSLRLGSWVNVSRR
ncbi:hypothetical protein OAG68_00220 [bacterium]|nr:hypothetical protein [bacterium]